MSSDQTNQGVGDGFDRSETLGLLVAGLWALGWIGYAVFNVFANEMPLDLAQIALGLLPLIAAGLWARGNLQRRALEDEIDELTARMVSLREHVDALEEELSPQPQHDGLLAQIAQIADAQAQTESKLAVFMSARPEAQSARHHQAAQAPHAPAQASLLPADMVDPHAPLSHQDFIRAANFPQNADDKVGFAVLKMALGNDLTSDFIRAAQDILTLLSQDGIYMDDLKPVATRPEIWRHFAQGARGQAVAPLGGIRDRKIVEKVSLRMKDDTVFRDAVHHYLRKFDLAFTAFAEEAADDELVQFGETRSARAFMLLGRIAGTFD